MTYREETIEAVKARLHEAEQRLAQALARKPRKDMTNAVLAAVKVSTWGLLAGLGLGMVVECAQSCHDALPDDVGGVITDRYHTEAYTTMQCTTMNKVTSCYPEYHEPTWAVRVAHDGHERVDWVTEEDWDETEVGQWKDHR